MNQTICTWCNATTFRKCGKRKTRQGIKQVFLCKSCDSKFSDGNLISFPNLGPKEPLPRISYPQDWPAYNAAQTQEGQLLRQILVELCTVAEQKRNKRGRPRAELRDLVYSICLKVYAGFSSRRLTSELEYATALDYISHAPHFNVVLKTFNSPTVTPILEELIYSSSLPCKMLEDTYAIDSTGFSSSNFSRWLEKKYGKQSEEKERVWVKAHASVGVKTNTIVALEVTKAEAGDSPQFIPLLEKTKPNAKILDVCADKAYSSRANMGAVAKIGAIPYIPFRSNATGQARGSKVWRTIYNYFILHREEFDDHYHQRSNIESTFSMVKRKFGNNVRSKSFIGMKNEILAKAVVHNICCLIAASFEFGISPELIWGKAKTPQTEPEKATTL